MKENKRFCYTGGRIWDEKNDKKGLSPREIHNFLNELYDTNQELYQFRLLYNALLFNNWYKHFEVEVYKSKRHYDGELCFDG